MIVLDASVLIAHLDPRDALHDAADERLLDAADQPFGASTITLAEALVAPLRTGALRTTEAALKDLEVEELPLPRGAAKQLAALRVETGLKLPDCCVLLAAEETNGGVVTFDERLARAAVERGLAV
ncbi:MAG TPA: PIN domain-containing protein [Conexibacter sp.]